MKEAANQGALQREGHKDEYRDQRGDGNSNKEEEKFVHYEPTPNWLVRSARHKGALFTSAAVAPVMKAID
jgi:hypothetical protein